jgi:hypothetical protein
MLYLNPPYLIVNGISVLPDHEDPDQFYYMPMMPKFSTLHDPVTGVDVPRLQIIKFRSESGKGGGFMNLDVNIGVPADVLRDVESEIKSKLKARNPRLSPIPVTDGTVKLVVFDKDSTSTTGPARFVENIRGAAKPTLYGDNQAAFSAEFSEEGVQLLEAAMKGDMSPIAIVYSLDFFGLRPSYKVKLHVDWDRVQEHMSQKFGAKVLFFSSDIEKAVDKLIDDRAIVFEGLKFTTEEDDPGSKAAYDRAKNQVLDMITDAFFQPSLDPVKDPGPSDLDKAAKFVGQLAMLHRSGGMSESIGFSYKRVDYKRIDQKRLNIEMSESTTVKRTIYPQGHLTGLFRLLRDTNFPVDKLLLQVSLDDPWFRDRRVRVFSAAPWQTDGIGSINVKLKYGDNIKSVLLKPDAPEQEVKWLSRLNDGAIEWPVEVSYEVSFAGQSDAQRPTALKSDTFIVDKELAEIRPRELYSVREISVVPVNMPWDEVTTVELALRLKDGQGAVTAEESTVLKKDSPAFVWRVVTPANQARTLEHRATFFAADQRKYEKPWAQADGDQVILTDPRGAPLQIDVMVTSSAWLLAESVFIDVEYSDPANGLHQSKSLAFQNGDVTTKSFVVYPKGAAPKPVNYRVTMVLKNGNVIEVPESRTTKPRVVFTGAQRAQRLVEVKPAGDTFASKKVKEVKVEIKYDGGGSASEETFAFDSFDDNGVFEYEIPDGAPEKYQYRVTTRFANGMVTSGDWLESKSATLSIPVG